MNVQDVPEEN
jgi:hypothetical protein